MNISDFNALFLASHPEYRRKLNKELRGLRVIVMALKPKYAKAIYEGCKTWEFRKAPPPLFKRIYIYESAPVSAVTGWVSFSESITGVPTWVWDAVKSCRFDGKSLPGITSKELEEYAGKRLVTALHVYKAERVEKPITFGAKPPQNWGRYRWQTKPAASPESEVAK